MEDIKAQLSKRFKDKLNQVVNLRHLIHDAKTDLKKSYYQKKLDKCNKETYGILSELAILDPKIAPKAHIKDEGHNE